MCGGTMVSVAVSICVMEDKKGMIVFVVVPIWVAEVWQCNGSWRCGNAMAHGGVLGCDG